MPDTRPESRENRFTALAHVVAEPMRRYLTRRTDPDTAQDVLADALLVLWRRFDDLPMDDPLPWCYAVARNCLANATRSAHRQRRLVQRLSLMVPRQGYAPALDDVGLDDALGQLSEGEREVIRLWAWEQLAAHEIALVLGVTPNAASIRLHRARKKLTGLLDHRKDPGRAGHEQTHGRRPE